MRRTIGLAAATALSVPCVAGAAQYERESLKDIARRNGGKTTVSVDVDLPMPSLAMLTAEAELIVQGTISKTEPRLTKTEEFVETVVTMTPTRFFKGGTGPARTPGFAPSVVFVQAGGSVRIDGLEIKQHSNLDLRPPLYPGEEILAFLTTYEGKLILHYGPFGLFRIRGTSVSAAREVGARRWPESDSLEHLQRTIQDFVSTRPR